MKDITILVFTEHFPYGLSSEQAFLVNEVNILKNAFKRVIIFPKTDPEPKNSNSDIEVNTILTKCYKNRRKYKTAFYAITSILFYTEFFSHKIAFWNKKRLFRLINDIGRAKYFRLCIENEIQMYSGNVILYSYWNNEVALALALIAKNNNRMKAITRAHNHDIYEEYYDYIPCLNTNVRLLDFIFCISKDGLEYLRKRFPGDKEKIKLFYLGVDKAMAIPGKNEGGIITVVSCSYINKKKRVDLIFAGLNYFVQHYDTKVRWIHFGDGPEMKSLAELIESEKRDDLLIELRGFIKNEEILQFYSSNFVDCFITTTDNEGLPVSLQEAQAHGIPIIATPANGIPEIVNVNNGILLSINPFPEEISESINSILKGDTESRRTASLESWARSFDSRKSHHEFAKELSSFFD